ncbi:MAG: response regulator [Bacteriovoracaceae bacterium]|jgi:CheY-like chemotaxis protein|nr:response regulator [Bacteriovoracaceae bacterium]
MNILVIDDEQQIREILSDTIKSEFDCEVAQAADGLDAFLMCREQKFDLIITDFKMPIMNGKSFYLSLKTKENLNEHSKIIFCTAFISEFKGAITDFEDVTFFEKPFKMGDLMDKIKEVLK